MEVPDYLNGILAKSDGETLFEHTWHVLSRLADQARLRSEISTIVGEPRLWHRMYWACLLHDFGKAAPGFQRMLASNGEKRWPYRHEVASLAFLPWLVPDAQHEDARWIIAAIASHHKDAATIRELYSSGGPAIRDVAAELAQAPLEDLWRWLNDYGAAWPQALGIDHLGIEPLPLLAQDQAVALIREQGVRLIEHALKSYRLLIDALTSRPTMRPYYRTTLALRGLIVNADHSASAHTGSPPVLPQEDRSGIVQRLGWQPGTLHTHQQASAQCEGNAVLIAPTGSGKTEAALFWAFGDVPNHLPRLFYALPYQASMNAMRARLDALFPGLVGLQHGRALQALYRVFIEDDDDPRFAVQRAKEQKNRTELNFYPVRVFSPYQMLKACYKLRGYEAIVSDYFNAAFIFDEIHAYEPKRLALILALIAYLRQQFQARFFVMSATLPDLIKEVLSNALGTYAEITADPPLFAAFQRHRLHLLSGEMGDPDNLAQIVAAARAGRSVLVCCNTVARAQEMWRVLRNQLGSGATIVLLHSRLNGRDRLNRERIVMEACGLTSDKRKPVVLVATQVVEVSLNIDLDTIFTDLAPLEALVQRFGRVNRGRKQRDSAGRKALAPVYVFREPIPEENLRPYDRRLLTGTLKLLEEHNGEPIDERSITDWLNTIYASYAGDYAQEWQATYDQVAAEFSHLLDSLVAFNADKDLEHQFYAAFDSIEVLPRAFEQEYFDLTNQRQFVEADALLVSIQSWQYGMLKRKGKLREGDRKAENPMDRVAVVLTQYDPDMGLMFDA